MSTRPFVNSILSVQPSDDVRNGWGWQYIRERKVHLWIVVFWVLFTSESFFQIGELALIPKFNQSQFESIFLDIAIYYLLLCLYLSRFNLITSSRIQLGWRSHSWQIENYKKREDLLLELYQTVYFMMEITKITLSTREQDNFSFSHLI